MHAVIRTYTGASTLMAEMERRSPDIEALITNVPGFTAYYAVRSGDGLTTITICDSEAGTQESTRRAAAWIKENLPSIAMSAPKVATGDVFLHFGQKVTVHG